MPESQENNMSESKIAAELRVKSCVVGQFPKPSKTGHFQGGRSQEVWEIKAEGGWGKTSLPMSLHFATDPGHPVVPRIGGTIKITIEA